MANGALRHKPSMPLWTHNEELVNCHNHVNCRVKMKIAYLLQQLFELRPQLGHFVKSLLLQAPLPTPLPTRFAVVRLDLVEYECENELDVQW